ncbi:hypothetical protein FRACYDRAFT_270531 [Fragilariopsis cylindrus CCMP1102]|uniref:Uncharacterized protein n=1 Tax=Fragilariopsis cylindrus CCMP1102 TaxID=635003 RepID=A0A1E7F2R9_9STRA|nr:hypothetical protein FRACYDRAFT_270531 [Fragilariopsis cylindrus CCMP1102]|eukprot:OEU12143.1 hypothetical protein FRACYDRAFT_270531 [Fragilariopsis cylindrus CCMP1102]
MQSADLAMYGHNNMNKQGGNYGFNLQQFNNNNNNNNNNVGANGLSNNNNNSNYGGNDTMNNNDINMNLNNMNHQHLLNQQFSAATGGSNDVNPAW